MSAAFDIMAKSMNQKYSLLKNKKCNELNDIFEEFQNDVDGSVYSCR